MPGPPPSDKIFSGSMILLKKKLDKNAGFVYNLLILISRLTAPKRIIDIDR